MQITTDPQIQEWGEIVDSYLPKGGYFVEVGAYDGKTHSCTYDLAVNGWRGVYIEPIKEHAQECAKNHRNHSVYILNYAICSDKLLVNGEWTTSNMNAQKDFNNAGMRVIFDGEIRDVKSKNLQEILDEFGETPDLLVIDTEGTEYQVLTSFDLNKYRPKMIVIEMHEESPEWNTMESVRDSNKKINEYLSSYKKIYSDSINSIFI